MTSIDLNCDLGENAVGDAVESELLSCVTSANIACGGHAGTPDSMTRLVRECMAKEVAIGAHPGYADPKRFGRVSLGISLTDIEVSVREQVSKLAEIALRCGGTVTHVKPHGALYHDAMADPRIANAIARAVQPFLPGTRLIGQPSTPGFRFWKERFANSIAEGFADRRYEPDGTLRSRTLAGAVLETASDAAQQAVSIARDGAVVASDGSRVLIQAQTICLHSDTPGAPEFAREVRQMLTANGVAVGRLD